MRLPFWRILLFLVGLFLIVTSFFYFRMVYLSHQVDDTWEIFEENMKWEGDIVPSLVSALDVNSDSEQTIVDSIARAWRKLMTSKSRKNIIDAYLIMHRTARHLIDIRLADEDTVIDPELKILIQELKDVKIKIDSLSAVYDSLVTEYDNLISTFPYSFIARATGYIPEPHIPLVSDGSSKGQG